MKASRYDLYMKVPGRSQPFYVVRRRTIDGGFECSCPRWVQQREECRHVRPVKAAMVKVPRPETPIANAIRRALTTWPFLITDEKRLADKLIAEVERVLS